MVEERTRGDHHWSTEVQREEVRYSGAVRETIVLRFDLITDGVTWGVTRARRYSSAGRMSPSRRDGPDERADCSVPSSVVSSAAKYAVGAFSAFCSANVASIA